MKLYYNDEVKALVFQENGNRFQAIVSDGTKSDIATITKYWFDCRVLKITKDISLIKSKVIEMCRELISANAKSKIKELFPSIDEEVNAEIEKEVIRKKKVKKAISKPLQPKSFYSQLTKLPKGAIRMYPLPSEEEINSLIFIKKKRSWKDTDWNESLGVSKISYTAFYHYKHIYEALPKLKEALGVFGYTDLKEVKRNDLVEKCYKLYGNKEATFQERVYNFSCYYKIRLAMAGVADPDNEDRLIKIPANSAGLQLPSLQRFKVEFKSSLHICSFFNEYVIGAIKKTRYQNIITSIAGGRKSITFNIYTKRKIIYGDEYDYYMANLIDKEKCEEFFSKLGCLDVVTRKSGAKRPEKWLKRLNEAIQKGEVTPEKALCYLWSYATNTIRQGSIGTYRKAYLKNSFFAPRPLHSTFFSYLFREIKEKYNIDYKRGAKCMQ